MLKKILVCDPDKSAGATLGEHLKRAGFAPVIVDVGIRVIEVAREELPSLIILETMFAEPTGFEICKRLQADAATGHLPIVMLSRQAEDIDRILGLELGAEDYLSKPYHPRELCLKARKIISRYGCGASPEGRIQLGDLVVDRSRCEVRLYGTRLPLTAIEFKLFTVMAERMGRVQSRERLLKDVWGYQADIHSRTLDSHIRKLRFKLDKHHSLIETVYGFGYRVADQNIGNTS